MNSGPGLFHTLLDPEFFENLDRYEPTDDFLGLVRPLLVGEWRTHLGGFWTNLQPVGRASLHEGWKIHISSTVDNGVETLNRVAEIVTRRRIGFKFCSDQRMLGLSLTKNWPRTGAGKFITIYPDSVDEFKSVIDECQVATAGMVGPFILSDRPYRDSRVVYYRYGEHLPRGVVNAYGNRIPTLVSETGEVFADDRVAHFRLPPWVDDPFSDEPELDAPGDDGVLLHDRYRIIMAIKFSSVGGIYQAEDSHTGEDVIVREARPMLAQVNTGYDAERLLEKEARILQVMSGTGLMPEYVDLFHEWEHSFLVQEKLEAESLWGYAMNFAFGESSSPRSMYAGIRDTTMELIRGLEEIHSRGIILRDMTRTNVMFTDEGKVRFIDLEFAYELDGQDPPVAGWTPGYASPEQLKNELPTVFDDYYALGVLLLDMISFTAPGYEINREGMLRSLAMDLEDASQPPALLEIVTGLTHPEAGRRWTPGKALALLRTLTPPTSEELLFPEVDRRPPKRPRPSPDLREDVRATLEGMVDYTISKADHSRHDRLWPVSGEAFSTNPTHLQYGAAGVGYFLLHAAGSVRDADLTWVIDHHLTTRPLPPGLYAGAAGVALFLWDAGAPTEAISLMRKARESPDTLALPNLYYGAAGWGLGNLNLWTRTGDDEFLEVARDVGDGLIGLAEYDEEGRASWESDGFTRLGYGEGQSGTATFYFYLYAATGDERYEDMAMRALDFDLEHAFDVGYGALWFPHTEAKPGDPKSPHIRYGSAGVGTAALRGYLATGASRYLEWAERCAFTVSRRFTNKLWHDYGMAGYCELLIDMFQVTGDEAYLNSAWYIAERLVLHRIERPEGFAYLGRDLQRISCDFGMGLAGIGLVFHRLLNPQEQRLLLPDLMFKSSDTLLNAELGASSVAAVGTP